MTAHRILAHSVPDGALHNLRYSSWEGSPPDPCCWEPSGGANQGSPSARIRVPLSPILAGEPPAPLHTEHKATYPTRIPSIWDPESSKLIQRVNGAVGALRAWTASSKSKIIPFGTSPSGTQSGQLMADSATSFRFGCNTRPADQANSTPLGHNAEAPDTKTASGENPGTEALTTAGAFACQNDRFRGPPKWVAGPNVLLPALDTQEKAPDTTPRGPRSPQERQKKRARGPGGQDSCTGELEGSPEGQAAWVPADLEFGSGCENRRPPSHAVGAYCRGHRMRGAAGRPRRDAVAVPRHRVLTHPQGGDDNGTGARRAAQDERSIESVASMPGVSRMLRVESVCEAFRPASRVSSSIETPHAGCASSPHPASCRTQGGPSSRAGAVAFELLSHGACDLGCGTCHGTDESSGVKLDDQSMPPLDLKGASASPVALCAALSEEGRLRGSQAGPLGTGGTCPEKAAWPEGDATCCGAGWACLGGTCPEKAAVPKGDAACFGPGQMRLGGTGPEKAAWPESDAACCGPGGACLGGTCPEKDTGPEIAAACRGPGETCLEKDALPLLAATSLVCGGTCPEQEALPDCPTARALGPDETSLQEDALHDLVTAAALGPGWSCPEEDTLPECLTAMPLGGTCPKEDTLPDCPAKSPQRTDGTCLEEDMLPDLVAATPFLPSGTCPETDTLPDLVSATTLGPGWACPEEDTLPDCLTSIPLGHGGDCPDEGALPDLVVATTMVPMDSTFGEGKDDWCQVFSQYGHVFSPCDHTWSPRDSVRAHDFEPAAVGDGARACDHAPDPGNHILASPGTICCQGLSPAKELSPCPELPICDEMGFTWASCDGAGLRWETCGRVGLTGVPCDREGLACSPPSSFHNQHTSPTQVRANNSRHCQDKPGDRQEESGDCRERSGEHQKEARDYQDSSGDFQYRSGDCQDRSGDCQDKSGDYQDQSGDSQAKSLESQGKSGDCKIKSLKSPNMSLDCQYKPTEGQTKSVNWQNKSADNENSRPLRMQGDRHGQPDNVSSGPGDNTEVEAQPLPPTGPHTASGGRPDDVGSGPEPGRALQQSAPPRGSAGSGQSPKAPSGGSACEGRRRGPDALAATSEALPVAAPEDEARPSPAMQDLLRKLEALTSIRATVRREVEDVRSVLAEGRPRASWLDDDDGTSLSSGPETPPDHRPAVPPTAPSNLVSTDTETPLSPVPSTSLSTGSARPLSGRRERPAVDPGCGGQRNGGAPLQLPPCCGTVEGRSRGPGLVEGGATGVSTSAARPPGPPVGEAANTCGTYGSAEGRQQSGPGEGSGNDQDPGDLRRGQAAENTEGRCAKCEGGRCDHAGCIKTSGDSGQQQMRDDVEAPPQRPMVAWAPRSSGEVVEARVCVPSVCPAETAQDHHKEHRPTKGMQSCEGATCELHAPEESMCEPHVHTESVSEEHDCEELRVQPTTPQATEGSARPSKSIDRVLVDTGPPHSLGGERGCAAQQGWTEDIHRRSDDGGCDANPPRAADEKKSQLWGVAKGVGTVVESLELSGRSFEKCTWDPCGPGQPVTDDTIGTRGVAMVLEKQSHGPWMPPQSWSSVCRPLPMCLASVPLDTLSEPEEATPLGSRPHDLALGLPDLAMCPKSCHDDVLHETDACTGSKPGDHMVEDAHQASTDPRVPCQHDMLLHEGTCVLTGHVMLGRMVECTTTTFFSPSGVNVAEMEVAPTTGAVSHRTSFSGTEVRIPDPVPLGRPGRNVPPGSAGAAGSTDLANDKLTRPRGSQSEQDHSEELKSRVQKGTGGGPSPVPSPPKYVNSSQDLAALNSPPAPQTAHTHRLPHSQNALGTSESANVRSACRSPSRVQLGENIKVRSRNAPLDAGVGLSLADITNKGRSSPLSVPEAGCGRGPMHESPRPSIYDSAECGTDGGESSAHAAESSGGVAPVRGSNPGAENGSGNCKGCSNFKDSPVALLPGYRSPSGRAHPQLEAGLLAGVGRKGCTPMAEGCTHMAEGCTRIAESCRHIAEGCTHMAESCTHMVEGCSQEAPSLAVGPTSDDVLKDASDGHPSHGPIPKDTDKATFGEGHGRSEKQEDGFLVGDHGGIRSSPYASARVSAEQHKGCDGSGTARATGSARVSYEGPVLSWKRRGTESVHDRACCGPGPWEAPLFPSGQATSRVLTAASQAQLCNAGRLPCAETDARPCATWGSTPPIQKQALARSTTWNAATLPCSSTGTPTSEAPLEHQGSYLEAARAANQRSLRDQERRRQAALQSLLRQKSSKAQCKAVPSPVELADKELQDKAVRASHCSTQAKYSRLLNHAQNGYQSSQRAHLTATAAPSSKNMPADGPDDAPQAQGVSVSAEEFRLRASLQRLNDAMHMLNVTTRSPSACISSRPSESGSGNPELVCGARAASDTGARPSTQSSGQDEISSSASCPAILHHVRHGLPSPYQGQSPAPHMSPASRLALAGNLRMVKTGVSTQKPQGRGSKCGVRRRENWAASLRQDQPLQSLQQARIPGKASHDVSTFKPRGSHAATSLSIAASWSDVQLSATGNESQLQSSFTARPPDPAGTLMRSRDEHAFGRPGPADVLEPPKLLTAYHSSENVKHIPYRTGECTESVPYDSAAQNSPGGNGRPRCLAIPSAQVSSSQWQRPFHQDPAYLQGSQTAFVPTNAPHACWSAPGPNGDWKGVPQAPHQHPTCTSLQCHVRTAPGVGHLHRGPEELACQMPTAQLPPSGPFLSSMGPACPPHLPQTHLPHSVQHQLQMAMPQKAPRAVGTPPMRHAPVQQPPGGVELPYARALSGLCNVAAIHNCNPCYPKPGSAGVRSHEQFDPGYNLHVPGYPTGAGTGNQLSTMGARAPPTPAGQSADWYRQSYSQGVAFARQFCGQARLHAGYTNGTGVATTAGWSYCTAQGGSGPSTGMFVSGGAPTAYQGVPQTGGAAAACMHVQGSCKPSTMHAVFASSPSQREDQTHVVASLNCNQHQRLSAPGPAHTAPFQAGVDRNISAASVTVANVHVDDLDTSKVVKDTMQRPGGDFEIQQHCIASRTQAGAWPSLFSPGQSSSSDRESGVVTELSGAQCKPRGRNRVPGSSDDAFDGGENSATSQPVFSDVGPKGSFQATISLSVNPSQGDGHRTRTNNAGRHNRGHSLTPSSKGVKSAGGSITSYNWSAWQGR
eukprot:jgi/Botrbrau1/7787/Bobra.0159s0215.1